MSITATNLTNEHAAVNGPYTTDSVSPGANRLLLLAVTAQTASGTQPPQPTITGLGLTWELVNSNAYDPAGSTDRASLFLFRAMGSPSSGTISIDFGATTLANADWSVDEFDGVDTSGTNGAGAIVQQVSTVGNNLTSLTVTLAAFADATNNVAYGTFAHQAQETMNPGSGFTTLANPLGGGSSKNLSMLTEYRTGQDTSVDSSWASARRCGGIAVEIKAGTAAPNEGSTTGVFTWTGSATGVSPLLVQDGSATGTHSWTGAATGAAAYQGSTTGTFAWTGSATGDNGEVNLPGLIDGVEPEAANGFPGPCIDSNGNLYRLTEEYLAAGGAGFGNHPMLMKSTDGGGTWTRVAASTGPGYGVGGSYNDMESAWLIHNPVNHELVVCWEKAESRWWGVSFRTSDHPTDPDSWDSGTFATSSGQDNFGSTVASESGLGGVALSDGRCRAFIRGIPQGGLEAFLHRTRTSAKVWDTGSTYITDAGVDMTRPAPVVADDDTTYLFYRDHTNGRVRYRTIAEDGTVGSSARVDSAGAGATDDYMNNVVPPVFYLDGSTHVAVVGFVNASNQLRTVEVRGGTVGSEEQVSTDTVTLNPDDLGGSSTDNQGPSAALAVHGTTLYALWGDATSGDLYYATRENGGSWSARTLLADTGSGNEVDWLYATVLTKPGGQQVLAYTYDIGPHVDDDSNIWYDELPLAASAMEGSASGVVSWTGSATGARASAGSAAGTHVWIGDADGARVSSGSASGTHTWTGDADGSAPIVGGNDGSATGTHVWTGAATGARASLGSTSGTFAWVGSATGVEPAGGTASGTHTWAGSATGARASEGAASGTHTWTGDADGSAPLIGVNNGSATGTLAWTGSATGARASEGAASGVVSWAGSATGSRTPKGSAAATHVWSGSATGATVRKGSATATHAWVGSATGVSPLLQQDGQAEGTHTWVGSATGGRMSLGQANGFVAWVGSATGARTSLGSVAATHVWSGTSAGARRSSGSATGTLSWTGSAVGSQTLPYVPARFPQTSVGAHAADGDLASSGGAVTITARRSDATIEPEETEA